MLHQRTGCFATCPWRCSRDIKCSFAGSESSWYVCMLRCLRCCWYSACKLLEGGIRRFVQLQGDTLHVQVFLLQGNDALSFCVQQDREYNLADFDHVLVVGAGKVRSRIVLRTICSILPPNALSMDAEHTFAMHGRRQHTWPTRCKNCLAIQLLAEWWWQSMSKWHTTEHII